MKKQSGFTLVEMLVVIGIIAILIAMLMPALNKVRQQAKWVECMSNLRQVGLSFSLYLMEYKYHLPPAYVASTVDPWYKYLDHGKFYHEGSHHQVLVCPSDDALISAYGGSQTSVSYRANFDYFRWNAAPPAYFYPYNTIRHPADKIALAEGNFRYNHWLTWILPMNRISPTDGVDERHDGGANYLWLDWHVTYERGVPDTTHWYNDPNVSHGW